MERKRGRESGDPRSPYIAPESTHDPHSADPLFSASLGTGVWLLAESLARFSRVARANALRRDDSSSLLSPPLGPALRHCNIATASGLIPDGMPSNGSPVNRPADGGELKTARWMRAKPSSRGLDNASAYHLPASRLLRLRQWKLLTGSQAIAYRYEFQPLRILRYWWGRGRWHAHTRLTFDTSVEQAAAVARSCEGGFPQFTPHRYIGAATGYFSDAG